MGFFKLSSICTKISRLLHSIYMLCKYFFPILVKSIPFFEIVLNSILLPFSGALILIPGEACRVDITILGKILVALSYSAAYAAQFYLFRYLLLALLKKNIEDLTNWIKMKILLLSILLPATVILILMSEDTCTLPHAASVTVYSIDSVLFAVLIGIQRGVLIKAAYSHSNVQMTSFDSPSI